MRDPVHSSAHLSLVGGAAIAIGLAEAALIAASLLGARGAFQYVPPRVWIVAPLCWLAVGAALWLLALPFSRRRASLFAVMAMIVLFVTGRFLGQPVVRIAIAAACAVVMCIVVALIARRWLAEPRRLVAWVAAAAIIAAAVLSLGGRAEAGAVASTPAAGPDVVVVFLDTVSYDAIFSRGRDVDPALPALARLASQSVVFDRAYTTAPWTLPAHFSAVTGLPAHRLGVDFDDQQYDLTTPTLAQRFRRRGYRTAAVLSNSFLNRGTGFQRGFDSFEQSANALDVCRTAPGILAGRHWPWFAATVCNWSASEVTSRALRQIEESARPLFLVLNYMDAHDPYYVERDCRPRGFTVPWPREVPPAAYRARYYDSHIAALRCIDRNLGRLFERLPDDAVIAVLSDHGEHFGDHGLVRHGNSLYAQLLHVPFMVRAPRREPGHVADPVSIAILPRLLEQTALDLASSSIVSYLAPPGATAANTQWSVIRWPSHLISRNGRDELYDLAADPAESKSLTAAPALEELRLELRRQQPLIDAETRGRFRSLGYVR